MSKEKDQAQQQSTSPATMAKETLLKIKAVVNNKDLSISEKIRQLHELKLEKGVIRQILGVRYQFVYQVIKRAQEEKAGGNKNKRTSHEEWTNLLNNL